MAGDDVVLEKDIASAGEKDINRVPVGFHGNYVKVFLAGGILAVDDVIHEKEIARAKKGIHCLPVGFVGKGVIGDAGLQGDVRSAGENDIFCQPVRCIEDGCVKDVNEKGKCRCDNH